MGPIVTANTAPSRENWRCSAGPWRIQSSTASEFEKGQADVDGFWG